ncbi:helix-turn-helix domain-containing protein [Melissococcus plutonius]|uniref:helix-turn-helix domain-containing protein n=5 Tax=Melissococcus plutonius TaxID=33970 RepID=UPI0021E600BE|nr:XRE family transcriptional regulator [Melissococcus plutonius]MCV2505679.1 XRE family transcriptional regulator [Melissococcus plutonius]
MSAFSKNLSYLMKQTDMSDEKLASLIGVNRTTITRWRLGERSPKMEKLSEIAQVFNVDPRVFIGEIPTKDITTIYNQLKSPRQNIVLKTAEQQLNEQKQEEQSNVISFNNSSNNNQLISFDWYGYVSAGTGEYLDGNERKSIIQLPKSDIPQNADFAVTVNGDSMKPVFKNHEMIFVERTTDLLSGSIGIIIVDGEAFVKKIYIHKDCITLVSLNPTYEDKIVRDKQSIKVIGRVII